MVVLGVVMLLPHRLRQAQHESTLGCKETLLRFIREICESEQPVLDVLVFSGIDFCLSPTDVP